MKFPEEKSRWRDFGPVSVCLYTLAGFWFSFGAHVSIRPAYFDIHFLWWVLSVMSLERGIEIRGHEEAYYYDKEASAKELA